MRKPSLLIATVIIVGCNMGTGPVAEIQVTVDTVIAELRPASVNFSESISLSIPIVVHNLSSGLVHSDRCAISLDRYLGGAWVGVWFRACGMHRDEDAIRIPAGESWSATVMASMFRHNDQVFGAADVTGRYRIVIALSTDRDHLLASQPFEVSSP